MPKDMLNEKLVSRATYVVSDASLLLGNPSHDADHAQALIYSRPGPPQYLLAFLISLLLRKYLINIPV
jgi:hypothetical protein